MDIIIQSLGFNAGESLESFINDKVNGLKSDHIVRANVTLYKGAESDPENNYCEIRLEVPGNDHFVKKSNTHFETAVSECVEVLKQQINKNKDKQTDRLQADAIKVQDAIMEGETDDEDVELEDVVKQAK
jgi:putative sigma-54 modulation protein